MPCLKLDQSENGPTLKLLVGVSGPRSEIVHKSGRLVLPLPVQAIIDTGASISCIDYDVIQILRLEPIGETLVHTVNSDGIAKKFKTFDVSLLFESGDGLGKKIFPAVQVVTATFYQTGIQALIGRDILKYGIFKFCGFSKISTLAFSPESHAAFYEATKAAPGST